MEKLGINPILILAQIVNFVIILFLLKKFLYQPIIKILDERKKKAEETEELNDQAKVKVGEIEGKEKEVIKKAKTEAVKIIAEAKADAQKEKETLIAKNEKEMDVSRKKMESGIEAEKAKVIKEAKDNTAEVAILISEKLLKESIDSKKHKGLINQAIKDLEKVSYSG